MKNNAIHCSFSLDIINLPSFSPEFENEIISSIDTSSLGVIEVWCSAYDCEHNKEKMCTNETIEIDKGGCMAFSRRDDWVKIHALQR